MDLKGKTIEEYFLQKIKLPNFPKGIDFHTRYKFIKDHLSRYIQESIDMGASLAERENPSDRQTLLTKHGRGHFEQLITICSHFVLSKELKLTPYEFYILLVSIQLHDIGNILGRINHERTAYEVFLDAFGRDNKYLDSVENSIINSIAQAHTGKDGNDKDRIGKLPPIALHNNESIRQRLLAALLRLGDELTDEPERAYSYLYEKGLAPIGGEIFHYYAKALTSTNINANQKEISLTYHLTEETATRTFQKYSTPIYLLDEIFERSIKLFIEKLYCEKFLMSLVQFEHINITINVYSKNYEKQVVCIAYRLSEIGYPLNIPNSIHEICSPTTAQIKDNNGANWTGLSLSKYITEHSNSI